MIQAILKTAGSPPDSAVPVQRKEWAMSIWLEDRIRDAVLAVRWKRDGEGLHPGYFVDASPDSYQLEGSAASFLADFIANHVGAREGVREADTTGQDDLSQYGLEVIASYLEDQGYTVISPD
jgi:hypothetical protein